MISRRTQLYCCEDISLIENYFTALSDKYNTWDCHHRAETDLNLTKEELVEMNMYWNRPAKELILLTKEEHAKLHNEINGNPMLNKTVSSETRKKLSDSHLNKNGKSVVQLSDDTQKHFITASEASRQTNIRVNHIIECCLGKRKSAGGYKWKYASDCRQRKSVEDIKPLF